MNKAWLPGIVTLGAASILSGCVGEKGKLSIRSTPQPLAGGWQSTSFRLAEAHGQMALGNIGLALEAYRKALREDASSIEAMAGIAAAYDKMGRFDLSRRHYEAALAIAPDDPRLYAMLTDSLLMQGRADEAARVRAELATRLAAKATVPLAPATTATAPASVSAMAVASPSAPPAPAPDAPAPLIAPTREAVAIAAASLMPVVTIRGSVANLPEISRDEPALAPAMAVAAPAPALAPTEPVRASITVADRSPGARLQRLSQGEVALVTRAAPLWKPRLVEAGQRHATIRFDRVPAASAKTVLLNAARVQGLAARTRAYLVARGFGVVRIGDAPIVRQQSVILYDASQRGRAVRLANQFGFALRHSPGRGRDLTVLLGRDAAADRAIRGTTG